MPKTSRRGAGKTGPDAQPEKSPEKSFITGKSQLAASPTTNKKTDDSPAAVSSGKSAVKSAAKPPRLPSAWQLGRQTIDLLRRWRGLLVGITLIYGGLYFLLVQDLSVSSNAFNVLRINLSQGFGGRGSAVASSISTFTTLFSSGGLITNSNTGTYQFLLFIIGSLAIIWGLRQAVTGNVSARVRDAYYRGMYPLATFTIILVIAGLELIPLLLGSALYGAVVGNGIATSFWEIAAFVAIFVGTALISLYLLSSTFLALYAVTSPDATPLKALRIARRLVRGRRLAVFRKVLFLALALLIVSFAVMIPVTFLLAALAPWALFLISIFALLVIHTYLYSLYLELARDVII